MISRLRFALHINLCHGDIDVAKYVSLSHCGKGRRDGGSSASTFAVERMESRIIKHCWLGSRRDRVPIRRREWNDSKGRRYHIERLNELKLKRILKCHELCPSLRGEKS